MDTKMYFFYEALYCYCDKFGSHCFQLGYFSSRNCAIQAIERVKGKPGFCDHHGEFSISKIGVRFCRVLQRKSGITVYELSHEYTDEEGYDNSIVFGIYATKKEAKEELSKKILLKPFKYYPKGFCIASCKIDLCGWQEGFQSEDSLEQNTIDDSEC